MAPRNSAIKTNLFAADFRQHKLDQMGDPLLRIASCIDFPALAVEVDRAAHRPVSPQGGRPPYPTETMVRILVLKRLYNLSDEQMEYQLLDRHSYQRSGGCCVSFRPDDHMAFREPYRSGRCRSAVRRSGAENPAARL